jgi:hypothetical protein
MKQGYLFAVAVLSAASAPLGAGAQAAVIFDQINASFTQVVANQEASGSAFTVRFVDDFTIGSAASVESVTIDLGGFTATGTTSPRFTSFANIGLWRVNIWSSEAQARANFFGDVYRATLLPADATYLGGQPVIPAGGLEPGQTVRTLVTLPLVTELAAGSYWIGVVPFMSFSSGQLGIANGGAGNSLQINPSGGFGFPGGVNERMSNAGYRLNGTLAAAPPVVGEVPEPASWAMLIAGFGLVGAAARRRRAARLTLTA